MSNVTPAPQDTYLEQQELKEEYGEIKEKIENIVFRKVGKINLQNGDVYDGVSVKDIPHGRGTYTWSKNYTYEGQFKNGRIQEGQAKASDSDGNIYEGKFGRFIKSDKFDFPNVNYKTEWEDDEACFALHGEGKFILSNGAVYEREFKKGFPDGQGTLTISDGSAYKGEFQKGYPHGQGKLTTADNKVYEGNFYSTYLISYLDQVKYSPYTDAFNRGVFSNSFVSLKIKDFVKVVQDRLKLSFTTDMYSKIKRLNKKLENLQTIIKLRTSSDIEKDFHELAKRKCKHFGKNL